MSTTAPSRNPLAVLEANFRRPRGRWGRAVGRLMAVQHRGLTVWAVGQLGVLPHDRVLDIGCGGGTALGLLSARATDGFVAGVDYSPEMVGQALARHRSAVRRGRVDVRVGDAMALPYADASFTHVTAIETLYFWPDAMRGLREAHRVLRPSGRIAVVLEMSREASGRSLWQRAFGRRFTERSAADGLRILSGADLTDLLRAAGFVDTAYVTEPDRSLGWLCATGVKAGE